MGANLEQFLRCHAREACPRESGERASSNPLKVRFEAGAVRLTPSGDDWIVRFRGR